MDPKYEEDEEEIDQIAGGEFPTSSEELNIELNQFDRADDISIPTLPENAATMRPLDKVTYLQDLNGSWQLSDVFCSVLGIPMPTVHTALPQTDALADTNIRASNGSVQKSLLWATALAISFLNLKCALNKDEWDMLAQKGNKWLAKYVRDVTALLKKATEFLTLQKV